MKNVLVTGGTVFVSKYVAEYFVKRGDEVWVLNRNNHPQVSGVHLIEADRDHIGDKLAGRKFDVILDINAYTAQDITNLLDSGVEFNDYIMISSSAVYPEDEPQPFKENGNLGENKFWGSYGTNKIEAERILTERVSQAYILRPPYLYGPYNNVYREAFVFECAQKNRTFYLPRKGEMKMQFFHVEDLCKLMEKILLQKPEEHVLNVGNETSVSIKEWATLCYRAAGKEPEFVEVKEEIFQRNYFSFHDYEYALDVERQKTLLPATISLEQGLKESYEWFKDHADEANRKPYMEFIDEELS